MTGPCQGIADASKTRDALSRCPTALPDSDEEDLDLDECWGTSSDDAASFNDALVQANLCKPAQPTARARPGDDVSDCDFGGSAFESDSDADDDAFVTMTAQIPDSESDSDSDDDASDSESEDVAVERTMMMRDLPSLEEILALRKPKKTPQEILAHSSKPERRRRRRKFSRNASQAARALKRPKIPIPYLITVLIPIPM